MSSGDLFGNPIGKTCRDCDTVVEGKRRYCEVHITARRKAVQQRSDRKRRKPESEFDRYAHMVRISKLGVAATVANPRRDLVEWEIYEWERDEKRRQRESVREARLQAAADARANNKCRMCGNPAPRKLGSRIFYCDACRSLSYDRVAYFGVAWEAVDRWKVFERDSWTCQHCKISTPESLCGNGQANSPELDHILPISMGGAHSYVNTQCLCHTCNHKKSNRVRNEPKLRHSTDWTMYRVAIVPARGREVIQEAAPRICECGCGESYTPFARVAPTGNARFKNGHWRRTKEGREKAERWMDDIVKVEICRQAAKQGSITSAARYHARSLDLAPVLASGGLSAQP